MFNLCFLAWRVDVFVFSGKNEEPKQSFSFQKSSLIGRTVWRISQVQGPIAYCLCSGLLFHLSQTLTVHCAGLYLAGSGFTARILAWRVSVTKGNRRYAGKKRKHASGCSQHQYLLMISLQLHSTPSRLQPVSSGLGQDLVDDVCDDAEWQRVIGVTSI